MSLNPVAFPATFKEFRTFGRMELADFYAAGRVSAAAAAAFAARGSEKPGELSQIRLSRLVTQILASPFNPVEDKKKLDQHIDTDENKNKHLQGILQKEMRAANVDYAKITRVILLIKNNTSVLENMKDVFISLLRKKKNDTHALMDIIDSIDPSNELVRWLITMTFVDLLTDKGGMDHFENARNFLVAHFGDISDRVLKLELRGLYCDMVKKHENSFVPLVKYILEHEIDEYKSIMLEAVSGKYLYRELSPSDIEFLNNVHPPLVDLILASRKSIILHQLGKEPSEPQLAPDAEPFDLKKTLDQSILAVFKKFFDASDEDFGRGLIDFYSDFANEHPHLYAGIANYIIKKEIPKRHDSLLKAISERYIKGSFEEADRQFVHSIYPVLVDIIEDAREALRLSQPPARKKPLRPRKNLSGQRQILPDLRLPRHYPVSGLMGSNFQIRSGKLVLLKTVSIRPGFERFL